MFPRLIMPPMFCFPQDMVFGSNELIYVAGSPLPIMMEEVDEEEEEVDPPSVPPRSKVARTSLHLLPVDFDCDPLPSSLPIENNSSLGLEEAEIPKPPHAKPRSKIKSTVTAFDDPVIYAETSKPPETLPRTRRGQKQVRTCVEIEPLSVSPPPRMYATIPRKKIDASHLVSFVDLKTENLLDTKVNLMSINLLNQKLLLIKVIMYSCGK